MWWIVLGIAYFILPFDADFIFPVGYIDDAIVMWMCYQKYKSRKIVAKEPRAEEKRPILIDARYDD